MKKSEVKFHTPFSPTILETEVPTKFIDMVNKIGDEVLSDEKKICTMGLVKPSCR